MVEGKPNTAWLAPFLHLSDSFYPTGTYAHSFGLEGLVQAGSVRDRETLRAFLQGQVLPVLARTDLAIASAAYHAAGDPIDWTRLRELCFLASAARGARELREASEAVGRQRLDFCALLHGGLAAEVVARANADRWPRPACVAAAIEGRVHGAPLDAVLTALVYGNLAGVVAAAVKLLRLGQNATHTLIAELLGGLPALLSTVPSVERDTFGSFNPWWDIASSRHEQADFRLFIS